jgi:hypothetical protein
MLRSGIWVFMHTVMKVVGGVFVRFSCAASDAFVMLQFPLGYLHLLSIQDGLHI